ncbi:MAG: PKD-like domain-containing protein [Flavobacteriales bacterium]
MKKLLVFHVIFLFCLQGFGQTTLSTNSQTVCAGSNVSVTATNLDPSYTFVWTAPAQITVNGALLTLNSVSQSITWTCTTYDANNNVIETDQFALTVNALPTVSGGANQTVCAGTSVTLSGSGASTYTWNNGVTNGAPFTPASTQTYTVTGTAANGCINSAQVQVTVNANPTVNGPNVVCVGSVIQLTGSPTPAASNAWTSQNPLTASISLSGLVTGISAGTAIITYTNMNGCSVTMPIFVNPLPTVSGNTTLCVGATSQLTGSGTPANLNPWVSSNAAVATISNTGLITANASGTASITYTNINGCNTSVNIVVNALPIITNSPLTQSICSGSTSSAVTWTSNIAGTTYSWTSSAPANITGFLAAGNGNLSAMNTIQNSSNTNGNITYTVTPTSNGCVGSPVTYTITVKPTPVLSQVVNQTICGGVSTNTTSFSNSVAGGSFNYTLLNQGSIPASVTGYIGNGSGQIPGAVINNGGTNAYTLSYAVVPTASGCNGQSGTFQITIDPAAVTSFSILNQTICSGQNTNAVNLTSATPNVIISWSLPNGVPAGIVNLNPTQGNSSIPAFNNLVNNTASPIQIIFNAQASNGPNVCIGAVSTYTITVNPLPTMTSASSLDACSGLFLNFSLTANVPSSFTWLADTNVNVTGESLNTQNSSFINNILTLANSLSTETVTYFITPTSSVGSCLGSTQQLVVTVHPIPAMTSTTTAVVCSGTALNIPLTSNLPSNFSWVATSNANVTGESILPVSASAITDNLAHILTTNQTVNYSVTPISIAGSCSGAPLSVVVTVKPLPVITSANSVSVCSGIPLNVNLTANIPSSITWIATSNANVSGESLTLQNTSLINNTLTPNSLIPQNVIYSIVPTSTIGGCAGNVQTLTVTVNPLPTMTSGTSTAICSGTPLNFSLSSNIPSNYSWYASANPIVEGESTTAQNASVINNTLTQNTLTAQNVTYTIIPTSSGGGCLGTAQTLTVTVNPLPSMTSGTTAAICAGTPLNFNLTSNITSSFAWLAANNLNVTGESLTAVNSTIINNTLFHPSTQNQETVSYTITPTSTLGLCVGAPQTLTVTVNPLPDSTISTNGPTVFCSGGNVVMSVPIENNSTYSWFLDGVIIPGGVGNSYLSNVSGIFSVITDNAYNCSSDDSITITVNPNPAIPVIVGAESLCLNSLNQVYTSSPNNNWLIWNINGANIYSGQHTNQVHLDVTSEDTVWIELTAHDLATGCYAIGSLMVLVDTSAVAPPYVNVFPLGNDNDLLCAPQATNVFRWGKINKLTNIIYLEPSVLTYHNFISLDTVTYYYFVDHGGDGCFTRSYYNYPALVTQVEEIPNVDFWLAPNPVVNELRIMSQSQMGTSISIEDLEGKCVYQGVYWTNTPINCANFVTGMYFVKIHTGQIDYVVKFLKL